MRKDPYKTYVLQRTGFICKIYKEIMQISKKKANKTRAKKLKDLSRYCIKEDS